MDLERSLAHAALKAHPADAARVLEGLPAAAAASFLRGAAPSAGAGVLTAGTPHFSSAVLDSLPAGEAAAVLEGVPVEVSARLLQRAPNPLREEILGSMASARARTVRSLMRYRPRSAASWMDPRALALPVDISAGEALKRLRRDAKHLLPYVYVLDRDDIVRGVLSLRELLGARSDELLGAVMRSPVQSIAADATGRAVLEHPGWQLHCALPVVDDRGVFLGAIGYRAYRQLLAAFRRNERDPRLQTARAIGDLFSAAVGGILETLGTATPSRRGGDER